MPKKKNKKTKAAANKPAKKVTAKKAAKKKTAKKAASKKAGKKAAPKKSAKKAPVKMPAAPKAAAAPSAKASAAVAAQPAPSAAPSLAGQPAPHFELPGDDGAMHSLVQHRGSPVVVYFYPTDDTPGCTTEACDFRDNMARVAAKGAVVYGISKDSIESHLKFKQKYGLNFTLLSDPDRHTHRAYGAWGEKHNYGQVTMGTIRSTFLIDRLGVVRRAWPKVKVEGHVDDVLKALEAL